MATEKQMQRWAVDWSSIKAVAGKKIDSVQFACPADNAGSERVIIRCQDGTRLLFETQPDGSIRGWLNCCGKPDGFPPPV